MRQINEEISSEGIVGEHYRGIVVREDNTGIDGADYYKKCGFTNAFLGGNS